MRVGAHVSVAGGLELGFERALEIGCESLQIFTHNQRQWTPKVLTDDQIALFKEKMQASGLPLPVVHCSYLINLCSTNDQTKVKSMDGLRLQFERAQLLGLKQVILHPGSAQGKDENDALKEIADSVMQLMQDLPNNQVELLFENTAGQGTNLGYDFLHLKTLIDSIEKDFPGRVGICFDTCHAWAAGYDISGEYESVFNDWVDAIPVKYWQVFHLNDALFECGSRKDRHGTIGQGKIGESAFQQLVNDERFQDVPGILEVPGGMDSYQHDLDLLKSFRSK